ncbi:DedD protein [Chitinivorax tropicus]|uniref:DedD protein n=1 Tax=Chitinivorax tropicus TaxID=714531 RepID=A0A840MRE7_9PROT|nr:SPOR domain-containing protein [Chitinivorax tropicus]MBB5018793.1 DedD protein [Chitinivorax tropicus]
MVQQTSNDELLQLKKRARRRLVGAVVLVLVAVVVLWNVLDSEPKGATQHVGAQHVEIVSNAPQLQATPAPDLASRPSPLDAAPSGVAQVPKPPEAAPSHTKPAPTLVEPPAPKPTPEPSRLVPKPAADVKMAEKPEAPKPKKEPAESKEAREAREAKEAKAEAQKAELAGMKADAKGSVAIQIAALSEDNKAKQLAAKLQQVGVPAYAEAKGPLTRVRAGPFTSRQQAENALEKLKSMGYSGVIVPR